MKKLLFLCGICNSYRDKLLFLCWRKGCAKIINSDTQIKQQQEQTLALEQSSAKFKLFVSYSLIALSTHTIQADKTKISKDELNKDSCPF